MSIQADIESKLRDKFNPSHLEVLNESSNHNVPPGSESHFKVTIVSESFSNHALIQRHRSVNECLKDELQNKIHALAIQTFSPDEWGKKAGSLESPPCLGGSKD